VPFTLVHTGKYRTEGNISGGGGASDFRRRLRRS